MAALTPSNLASRHVAGDLVIRFYSIPAGNSGDTLAVNQIGVEYVDVQVGTTITGVSYALGNGNTIITFTASAPFTNARIQVWSRKG